MNKVRVWVVKKVWWLAGGVSVAIFLYLLWYYSRSVAVQPASSSSVVIVNTLPQYLSKEDLRNARAAANSLKNWRPDTTNVVTD